MISKFFRNLIDAMQASAQYRANNELRRMGYTPVSND